MSAFSIKDHISVHLESKECIYSPLHIAGEEKGVFAHFLMVL